MKPGVQSLFYLSKTSHLEHPKLNINATIRFKTGASHFTLRATSQAQYKSPSSAKKPTNYVFPHKVETWDPKPIQPANILTIMNLRSGNVGTGKPSLSSSQSLSISIFSLTVSWSFGPVIFLCIFQHFCYWHFHFSLVKAPLAFIYYTFGILGLNLHK